MAYFYFITNEWALIEYKQTRTRCKGGFVRYLVFIYAMVGDEHESNIDKRFVKLVQHLSIVTNIVDRKI